VTKLVDWSRSATDIANELVPIVSVLRQFGVDCPDVPDGVSVKLRCVWSYLHPDGGLDASMRVYGSDNHAWCFAGCDRLTPVRIYSESNGLMYSQGARLLLDEYGFRPLHWTERARNATNRMKSPPSASLDTYAQALVAAARNTVGPDREFDPPVLDLLSIALTELAVSPDPKGWFDKWKIKLATDLSSV
jgi:hypothetical protein